MKHFKHLVLFLILLLPAWLATAQQRSLSLREAIDLSLQNSKQLKSAKARIDQATAAVDEAKERKLPDFSITGSYLYLPVNPTVDLKTGGNGGSPNFSVRQAMYGIANVSLPVFAGGKIRYGIESAGYLQRAAQLDADQNSGEIALNTINAYNNLYKASATIDIVKESLAQSRQRDSDYARLERNGLLARNDLLKAALQTKNIELTLLDAQSNARIANTNMDLMLGLPEQTQLVVTTPENETVAVKALDAYEQDALVNRKDIQALNERIKASRVAVKADDAEKYPSVALTGGYIAADIPGFLTITNAVNLGVGVKYNLSNIWKRSKIREDQARVREQEANNELLDQNIRLQVNKAYETWLLATQKIQVYDLAVTQANENYRITQNKYNNALATTTDVLDAEVAQLQAKLNAAFGRADARVAYQALLQATGTLSTQNNITNP